MKTRPGIIKTMENYQEPWKINLESWKTIGTDLNPWKLTWHHKKMTWNYKDRPGTMNYPQNPLGTMKNQPGTFKNHKNQPGAIKTGLDSWITIKTHLEPWKTSLEPWLTNMEQGKTITTWLRVVTSGYGWLQGTPRRMWWFFVTHKQTDTSL